jgi:RNA polymerase sigma-B factor
MSHSTLTRAATTGTASTASTDGTTSTSCDELFTVLAGLPRDSDAAQECRTAIIESYLPMATRLARKFRNRGPSLDDLIQVARVGLVASVDRFDPERGAHFAPFAITTILGELKRYFRDTAWAIRVPRALQEQYLMVNAARSDLNQRAGSAPTPTQLSTALGLPIEDVKAALHAGAAYNALSLDAASSTPSYIAEEYLRDDATGISSEDWIPIAAAVRRLPERERRVIYLRFFEDLSQGDIAREIGVSQMQVSRILSRVINTLHDELTAA